MSLWLSIPVYWVLLWAASRRKRAYPLPFFLPPAFLENLVWAGLGAILGITMGVWVENRFPDQGRSREFRSAAIFTAAFLFEVYSNGSWTMTRGIIGGIALYCASSGLFPEGMSLKETLFTALGGILGFILGVAICFL